MSVAAQGGLQPPHRGWLRTPPLLRHEKKITYILGAGFSCPAGLSIMSKFIPAALRSLKAKKEAPLAEKLAQVIRRYQPMAASLGLDLDNLEDLFCLADLDQNRHAVLTLKHVIAFTTQQSCECAKTKDREPTCCENEAGPTLIQPKHAQHPLSESVSYPSMGPTQDICVYQAFLSKVLKAQEDRAKYEDLDTVISLNYDMVIENARAFHEHSRICYGADIVSPGQAQLGWLARADSLRGGKPPVIRPGLNTGNAPGILLLKIHGSINWQADKPDIASTITVQETLPGTSDDDLVSRIPLVPPSWRRGAADNTIWTNLVDEAIFHLQKASKIVIIGYYLPDTDRYFRYLLANALSTPELPEVQIWDVIKDRSAMESHLSGIFGPTNVKRGRIYYSSEGLCGYVRGDTAASLADSRVPGAD